ncbi:MAG: hypothetical protein STSR0001_21690 [Methanothrix sp.]
MNPPINIGTVCMPTFENMPLGSTAQAHVQRQDALMTPFDIEYIFSPFIFCICY